MSDIPMNPSEPVIPGRAMPVSAPAAGLRRGVGVTRSRLGELLRAFVGREVAVVGDLMVDRYIWGDAVRISPEAPVPVVSAQSETARLGAAANVALNIAALGGKPIVVGVRGDDAEGERLEAMLTEHGLSVAGVVVSSDRPTTVKTRIIARHQQVVRFDVERDHAVPDETAAALVERIPSTICGLVLSDYGKGVVQARLLDRTLSRARAASIPVAVDPKETHFFDYRGVNVLTPNLAEASRALGRTLRGDADVEAGGRELCERLDSQSVLITRGEEGMSLVTREGAVHLPALAEAVFDVTGAGDTVVSVFALAMAAGATLVECAELANRAASLSVREVGTTSVAPAALVAAFGFDPLEDERG